VKSACDGWYSFADIVSSKLITGKCPEILETIEFVPVGRQTTNIIKIFGDPNYTVDLAEGKDDLFVKVIELRTTVKADRDKHPKGSPEYDRLDAMQLALKLLANATSYGVLVEVVVDEKMAEVPCWVYHGGAKTLRKARKKSINAEGEWEEGFKVERPGKYFAPFGGLIPAAGRLLLAITETLIRREGLLYIFCDTDSACLAGRPATMPREEFRAAVQRIAGPEGWFQPLTPYSDGEPLFALEDVNYKLRDDTSGKVDKNIFEPLYCLAISAKRYVLFNIVNNQTLIRKISGHGLGGLRQIKYYNPKLHKLTVPEHIAAPSISSLSSSSGVVSLPMKCLSIDTTVLRRSSPILPSDFSSALSKYPSRY
jgi:hypothetical protein